MKFKRKQPDKNAIPTPAFDEDTFDLENLANEPEAVSSQYYPNYDPDPTSYLPPPQHQNVDIDTNINNNNNTIVLVKPPTMNQIDTMQDNVRDIQTAINMITQYMNALQNNISPGTILTTKQYFTFQEPHVNKLDYKTIMVSILNNNVVNRQNFYALSNMFYYYYIKLFDNIVPLAHIIVNVNYTRGKTRITHSLTAFLNLCAHYVVSNIKQLFSSETYINIPDEYYKIITDKQHCLTNLYNFRLNDLRIIPFVKHTYDNDANTFQSESTTSDPNDHIISFPIRVLYNVPNLKFE